MVPNCRPASLLTSVLLVATVAVACGDDPSSVAVREDDPTTTTTVAPSTTVSQPTTTASVPTGSVVPAATSTTRRAAPPVTAQPQVLPFRAAITRVTASDLYASWRPGCPVPVDQLRAIDVTHFGNDGAVHTGRVVVAASLASGVVEVFRDLYEARFPIERMEPIDVYGGDDNRSIKANNTSAFNCRPVTGGGGWSEHAYGRAIDVNPFVNPYVKGSTVLPPEAAPYRDRTRDEPGMIHAGDEVVDAFAARGWRWGGYWSSLKDYQHFSTSGR